VVDSALYSDGSFAEDLKLELERPLEMNGRTVILQASRKIPRAVVELLERGLPYREIHRQTGVSVTTVGRVARYLTSGNGGYRAVTERLKIDG